MEEAVRRDDEFSVWQLGELRNRAAGLRKMLKAPELRLGTTAKATARAGILVIDVADGIKELLTPRRRETNPQRRRASNSPASAKTESKSNPLPLEISRSPRARRRRI